LSAKLLACSSDASSLTASVVAIVAALLLSMGGAESASSSRPSRSCDSNVGGDDGVAWLLARALRGDKRDERVGSVACVSNVIAWDKVSPLRWRLDDEEAAGAARLLPLFGGIIGD